MSIASRTAHDETGTVYGVLLNDRATVDRLRTSFDAAPYKAPPRAPVLYIKSRNTFAIDGCAVAVPSSVDAVRIDGTIGVVIGTRACRVDASQALAHVAGYVIASDVTLPYESYYRPAVRQRCRDGFLPMTAPLAPPGFDLGTAQVRIVVNGSTVHRRDFGDLVRAPDRLIAEMTAFMTLEVGDIVLLGLPEGAPLAKAGDRVEIVVPGLGSLSHRVVAEAEEA